MAITEVWVESKHLLSSSFQITTKLKTSYDFLHFERIELFGGSNHYVVLTRFKNP